MILLGYLLHKGMFVRSYCRDVSTNSLAFCVKHYAQVSQTIWSACLRHVITAAT